MNKIKKLITRRRLIIAIIVLAGIGIWRWRASVNSNSANIGKEVAVTRGMVRETIAVSGKIVADKQATLNFMTTGKLAYVNAREGDKVVAGQALMGLDTGDLKAAEQTAYYRYLAADANAKEVEDDLKGKDTTETFAEKNLRVAAQTARDVAYDAWLTAQRAVRNANLISPFAGVVTNMTVNSVGDTVGLTDGVTVVEPGGLHFEGEVDETDIGRVVIGQIVEVKLDAFEGKTFTGTISKIGFASRVSSTGATVYPVEVKVGNLGNEVLRLGMNGDADIIIKTVENTLMLPIEAVNDGYVILPGEKEDKKEVTTGVEGEMDIEVKSGLNEGDKVIVK